MRSPGTSASTLAVVPPGRNHPCPCGSGRKFKRCCSGAAPQMSSAASGKPFAGPGAIVKEVGTGNRLNIGPLTEAGGLKELAARARELQSGPPAGLFAKRGAAGADHVTSSPRRMIGAERYRQQGVRLFQAGKFDAAITALRQAIKLGPEDAGSHHALGLAFSRRGRLDEAAASLRIAIILKDDFPAAHFDLANALDGLSRSQEAMTACRRAVELAPQLAEGHRLLGELLDAVGESEEAAESFRRAASASSDDTAGRLDLVRALVLRGDFQEAETQLRHAIALDPGSDELHRTLGQLLATQGRFDEAIEACDRALGLNPLQVPAHLTAVRIRKCTEADRPRLTRMVSTLRDCCSLSDAHRQFLHFAIGKLLDDLGEYRHAMRHFDIANSLRGRNARLDRAAFAGHISRLLDRFTSDFFAANAVFGLEDETPLLIVGMPRSGTTLVEQIVSSHPAIAAGGELFYWFNRARLRGIAEATVLTPASGRRLAAEYLSLLHQIGPSAARVTDKQTFNFQQLGLIHLLLPKARIVHCRRHPIDTCLSMYFTHFKGKIEFVSNKADLAFAYQQYARMMEHWRRVLPSDCFLEVDYEELVADREVVTRRLIASCGLDWHDACLQPEHNERRVNTASVWQARQPVYSTSIERWRKYEPWIGDLCQLSLGRAASDI
jgi:tetratricopeptide (TPR) repeat protein